ncbi:MAG TPA: hypothetical protein VGJ26_14065 [Pirellulales bacterium]
MAKRSIPNPRPFEAHDGQSDARESQGPRFDTLTSGVRQRAAQWNVARDLLAAAVANRPEHHAPAESHSRPARQFASGHAPGGGDRRSRRATSGAPRGDSAERATETWQLRQLELLERIDENIRRLRELQESARPPQSAFTDPAY